MPWVDAAGERLANFVGGMAGAAQCSVWHGTAAASCGELLCDRQPTTATRPASRAGAPSPVVAI